MTEIAERLGYRRVFRYEKYRTEFHQPRRAGVAMLDETPVGVFLELEGTPHGSIARRGAWVSERATILLPVTGGSTWIGAPPTGCTPGDMTFE